MNRNENGNLRLVLELRGEIMVCGNSLGRFRSQTLYPIELRARITLIISFNLSRFAPVLTSHTILLAARAGAFKRGYYIKILYKSEAYRFNCWYSRMF